MLVERQFQSRVNGKVLIFICAVIIVLTGTYLFAAEQTGASEPARYRVYSLKHISAEQGKQYLAEAGIGTVSQLANTNALLVTALPRELMKTTAILALVDSKEQFVIKAILPASEANSVPPKERIEAELGDVSIGTFSNPPSGDGKAKAIIDIHNDAVIAIAPVEKLEKIIFAIERLRKAEPQASGRAESGKPVEPNQAGQPETEEVSAIRPKSEAELYKVAGPSEPTSPVGAENREPDELFGLLAKGEEMAARYGQVKTRPNEPNAVAIAPGREAPAKPSAATEQPPAKSEVAPETPQQPQQPGLPEGPEAKAAAEEPKIKPESEPAIGEEVVMAGKPKEVAEPCAAVRSYQPGPISGGEEMLELSLPEKLNIVDLLDLVGKYLHLDYLYDEAEIKGEVALKVQGPIKIKDLYPLLESVLKFKDFVMTRKGNLVTIVPVAKVLEVDPALLHDEMGNVQVGDVIVTRVFNLRYIDTTSAKNLLDGMKLSVSVTPIPETATIIVTGYAYRMARLEEILSIVDRPGEPKQFRFRQLKYTMASTLAPKIKTLIEQLGDMSITIAKPAQEEPATRRGRAQPRKPAGQPGQPAAPGGPTVYLDADERTNRILMIGVEGELAIVEQLVDTLDVAQQDLRTMRLYELQHVGADEVKAKLAELGVIGEAVTTTRGAGRSRISTQPGAAQPGATPPTPVATAEGLVEQPQVVIIEATNSLLVNGTAEQHAQIALILSYVDSKTLEEAIPYEIYSLENQDPENLAEVLQKFIQETIKDKEGKIEKTIKKTEEEIVVVPDKNTFSIIVYASKKNQEWVGKLIKKLDTRRPQVLIDVSLVEITKKDDFLYDLNIVANAEKFVTGNIQIKETGFPNTSAAGKGSLMEGGFKSSDITTNPIQGFYADDRIQALLTAMAYKKYGRVLAKPKILVNDNEEGKINTTKTVYVSETQITYPPGATGEVQPLQSTTYKPYEAKIELSITPHISEGELLRLEVNMMRQDFEKGKTPPDTTTSNVKTVVTVPDGFTIILGGLTKLDQTKSTNKVPLLGDIPVVGALFRGVKNTADDSQLYIFVKANILRPDQTAAGLAQLRTISSKNKGSFEEYEDRFQKHEAFPGIKPEPIDPLHVLDKE